MKVKLVKIYIVFCITFGVLALAFVVNGVTENTIVRKQIKEFMSRGTFVEPSEDFYYDINSVRYYKVNSKYDYEDTSVHNYNFEDDYIGTTGDILITNRNPLPEFDLIRPIIKYFWLGHSALVIDEEGKYILEIVGNDTLESNEVQDSRNDFGSIRTGEVLGLRVRHITTEQKDELMSAKNRYYGKKYNFLFIIKLAHRFYCIDLVSRIFEDINININYDFWVTTGSDIISSSKTYIFYYSYVDKNGIMHKYFLE